MDAEEGVALLRYALEREEDELIFRRWVQGPQYTMSFDAFKASLAKPKDKPSEVILEDVETILGAFEAERMG